MTRLSAAQAALLFIDNRPGGLMVANFMAPGWFEVDVGWATPTDQFHEYEIKLSRADFKADFRKSRRRFRDGRRIEESKHELLAGGGPGCPHRFSFLTPQGLLQVGAIPPYAGLVEFTTQVVPGHGPVMRCRVVKRSRRLHSRPLDPLFRQSMLTSFYHRTLPLVLRNNLDSLA